MKSQDEFTQINVFQGHFIQTSTPFISQTI